MEFPNTESFLGFFKSKGCYLDDLCSSPVDNLPDKEREQILHGCVEDFSKRLKSYKPDVVIVILKRIRKYVEQAVETAGLECPVYTLPFPGQSHQGKYIDSLAKILREQPSTYMLGQFKCELGS
jgi:hypothetical protein